jgi:hypothetical protein
MSASKGAYSISRAAAETLARGAPISEAEADAHYSELKRIEATPALGNLFGLARAGGRAVALPSISATRVVSAGAAPGLVGEKTFVDSDLLEFSAVRNAGATVLTNLRENVRLVFTSVLPEPDWIPELGFAPESDPEFESVELGPPRRVCGVVVASKQLLIQGAGDPSLDQFLLRELSRQCSSQLDTLALYGPAGNLDAPTGIAGTAGIHRLDIAAAPPWEFLVQAEALVEVERVSMANFAFITNPDIKRILRTTLREVGGDTMIWEHLERKFSSNQVTTSEIFFGCFDQLVLGIWASSLIVNQYSRMAVGLVELVADLYCSVAIRRPACFGIAGITSTPPPFLLRGKAEVTVKNSKSKASQAVEEGPFR